MVDQLSYGSGARETFGSAGVATYLVFHPAYRCHPFVWKRMVAAPFEVAYMKKIVPDPPLGSISQTATTAFGSCDAGHAPLFAVREGINAEDALVHASLLLQCTCDTAHRLSEKVDEHGRNLVWSLLHSAESAKALVDALLDGIEDSARR